MQGDAVVRLQYNGEAYVQSHLITRVWNSRLSYITVDKPN